MRDKVNLRSVWCMIFVSRRRGKRKYGRVERIQGKIRQGKT
jgi:hypothetical protein